MTAGIPTIRIVSSPPAVVAEAVLVIDVIRAFTTAAAAFLGGAERILCVEHVEDALGLRRERDDVVLMGEVRGLRPDGFDLGNSPTEPTVAVVGGRTLVQRTSNGTRGLVGVAAARFVAAVATVNVGATAAWVRSRQPATVDLLVTGSTGEDRACAEHLAALLRGERPSDDALADQVRAGGAQHVAAWRRPRDTVERASFLADIERCAAVDVVGFAMPATTVGPATVELRRVDVG